MEGFLERSFVVSARVDARDMATVVKWLSQNGVLGRQTKSSVVAQALKVLAATVGQQDESLRTDTLEQAYMDLSYAGLVSNNVQSVMALKRGLQVEHLSRQGTVYGDNSIVKMAKKMFSGQGFGGDQLVHQVQLEQAKLAQQPAQSKYNKSEYQIDVECIEAAAWDWLQRGGDPEEVERDKQQQLKKLLEKQQQRMNDKIVEAQEKYKEMKQAPQSVAQTREQKLDMLQREAERQVAHGHMSETEAVEWLAQQTERMNKLHDEHPEWQ